MHERERDALDETLAAIADEAEAGEADQSDRPIPAHVKVTRGNPRAKVLQVRLNEDEYAAIEEIAEARGLPTSTVARAQLLKLIASQETDDPDQLRARIDTAADTIKELAFQLAVRIQDQVRVAKSPVQDKVFRRGKGPVNVKPS